MPAAAGPGSVDPDTNPGAPDEFCSTDEVKVFKDEGEDESEQSASKSLQAELLEEEKSSLITESEQGKDVRRPDFGNPFTVPGFPHPFGLGSYLVNPYAAAYTNAQLLQGRYLPGDPLGSPPPAHMAGLSSALSGAPSLYPPYLHTLGMEQLAQAWHYQRGISPYSLASLATTPPPTSLAASIPTTPISGFSPGLPHHPAGLGFPPGLPHPHLPHIKQEYDRPPGLIPHPCDDKHDSPKKKEPHIKKPLNAFMLYMKEMRPIVQAECTLKESAAINQILGRRWHGLSREEQAKYYEKARQERQRHMQMYPHWNARDNYRYGQKKKKRKRDKSDDPAASMKKCRARYGLDQQNLWCKPCRRKKKCIRVQMYLAGRSEQEIEATQFDEEGEAIPPLASQRSSSSSSTATNGNGGTSSSATNNGSNGHSSSSNHLHHHHSLPPYSTGGYGNDRRGNPNGGHGSELSSSKGGSVGFQGSSSSSSLLLSGFGPTSNGSCSGSSSTSGDDHEILGIGSVPGGGVSPGGASSIASSSEGGAASGSIRSPATPSAYGGLLGGMGSNGGSGVNGFGGFTGLGSPSAASSIASPATPGSISEDWFRGGGPPSVGGGGGGGGFRPGSAASGHHRPPVGTDPRDAKNPLSISSLTGSGGAGNNNGSGSAVGGAGPLPATSAGGTGGLCIPGAISGAPRTNGMLANTILGL